MSTVKIVKRPGSDGMYTVSIDGQTIGMVDRVGYGQQWIATLGTERQQKSYVFRTRVAAMNALLRANHTGDTREITAG